MCHLEVGEKKKTGDAPGDDGALVGSDDEMKTREHHLGSANIILNNDNAAEDGDADEEGSVVAAQSGYIFYGLFNFICFGPLTEHFSATLAFGALVLQSPSQRKNNARAAQRAKESEHRDAEHSVCAERGLSLQSKFKMGMIAQK
jgi:hypothetical protein